VLLPVSLAYIVILASAIVGLQFGGFSPSSWQFSGALFGVNVLLLIVLFFILDRGRIVSPAYSRLDPRHLERLRAVTAARTAHQMGAQARS